MKLLLTSTGLTNKNIANEFLKIINKKVSKIKILFVTTAARNKEELKYLKESLKELIDFGILKNNIIATDLDQPVFFEEIKDFDVIYVCGGNTFYLLKIVRETNFDEVIKKFVKMDRLYLGVSAGSILVCPNIDIASPFDENDVHLTNLLGLNLIEVIISPHYKKEEKIIIDKFKKKSKYKVITLTNNQALSVDGEKQKIIE